MSLIPVRYTWKFYGCLACNLHVKTLLHFWVRQLSKQTSHYYTTYVYNVLSAWYQTMFWCQRTSDGMWISNSFWSDPCFMTWAFELSLWDSGSVLVSHEWTMLIQCTKCFPEYNHCVVFLPSTCYAYDLHVYTFICIACYFISNQIIASSLNLLSHLAITLNCYTWASISSDSSLSLIFLLSLSFSFEISQYCLVFIICYQCFT